jgi:flagellar motor switch protein FliM
MTPDLTTSQSHSSEPHTETAAETLLSQGEVQALLHGAPGGGSRSAVEAFVAARAKAGDAFPLLETLMDRAAQDIQLRLRNFLFDNVNCTFESIRYTRLGPFISGIELPSLCIVAVAPEWSSPVILSIPAPMVYTAVDNLLGGRAIGEVAIEGRTFSSVEQRLMKRFAANFLEGISAGFSSVVRPSFMIDRVETVPRFAMTSGPTKQVVVARFRIEANDRSGSADLCIPTSAFGGFHDVLSRPSMAGEDDNSADQLLIVEQVLATEVELVGVLQEWEADLEELSRWSPGMPAPLDPRALRRVVVAVSGQPLFVASLIGTGRKARLRIDEFCEPDVEAFPKAFTEAVGNDGDVYVVPLRRFETGAIR